MASSWTKCFKVFWLPICHLVNRNILETKRLGDSAFEFWYCYYYFCLSFGWRYCYYSTSVACELFLGRISAKVSIISTKSLIVTYVHLQDSNAAHNTLRQDATKSRWKNLPKAAFSVRSLHCWVLIIAVHCCCHITFVKHFHEWEITWLLCNKVDGSNRKNQWMKMARPRYILLPKFWPNTIIIKDVRIILLSHESIINTYHYY